MRQDGPSRASGEMHGARFDPDAGRMRGQYRDNGARPRPPHRQIVSDDRQDLVSQADDLQALQQVNPLDADRKDWNEASLNRKRPDLNNFDKPKAHAFANGAANRVKPNYDDDFFHRTTYDRPASDPVNYRPYNKNYQEPYDSASSYDRNAGGYRRYPYRNGYQDYYDGYQPSSGGNRYPSGADDTGYNYHNYPPYNLGSTQCRCVGVVRWFPWLRDDLGWSSRSFWIEFKVVSGLFSIHVAGDSS